MSRQSTKISNALAYGVVTIALGMFSSACTVEVGSAEDETESLSQALCATTQFAGLTATASSIENSGTPASAAVDSNMGTRWSSAFSDPQWIRVDLGASRWIDNVVLNWEAASAADYTLQISSDGTSWTTVKTVTNAAPGARTDTLTGLSSHVGRYVRMNGTRRTTGYGYSLWEFKVNGDANPNCSAGGPVCGNRAVETGEQCDDGNTVNTDACTNACKLPACGDAICSSSETCSSCAGDCGTCATGRSIASNLEAETNDGMFGVQYETTSDVGGGKNAGWIDFNDYIEWKISVPTAGNYTVTTRSATVSATSLQLLVDGTAQTSLNLTNTGGYQKWASFVSSPIALTAGLHTLRVRFTGAGQNLNWVKVSSVSAVSGPRVIPVFISATDSTASEIAAYKSTFSTFVSAVAGWYSEKMGPAFGSKTYHYEPVHVLAGHYTKAQWDDFGLNGFVRLDGTRTAAGGGCSMYYGAEYELRDRGLLAAAGLPPLGSPDVIYYAFNGGGTNGSCAAGAYLGASEAALLTNASRICPTGRYSGGSATGGTADCRHVGVYAHELGHTFGLPHCADRPTCTGPSIMDSYWEFDLPGGATLSDEDRQDLFYSKWMFAP